MKKILSYLLLSLIFVVLLLMVVSAGAQTTRIKLVQIEKSNTVNGTKANQLPLSNGVGDLRYAQYTEINPTPIGYTPALTGNPAANYAQFVKPANGDVWYIDNEGRGIRLYVAANAGDYDWLEIGNNQIPNSITDSIYKYKYASVGGRYVWPTAEMLVIDSVAQGMFIVAGDRKAKVALYDTNNQTWSTWEQGGGTTSLIMQSGGTFAIQTAGSGTPQAPGTPITDMLVINGDSSIQFPQYPNTRTDPGTPTKLWGPDATGKMKNYDVNSITNIPISQAGHGFSIGSIISKTNTGYALAENDDLNKLAIGVVNNVFDANTFSMCSRCVINYTHGKPIKKTYYFTGTPGTVDTIVTNGSLVINPAAFITLNSTQIQVLIPDTYIKNTGSSNVAPTLASVTASGNITNSRIFVNNPRRVISSYYSPDSIQLGVNGLFLSEGIGEHTFSNTALLGSGQPGVSNYNAEGSNGHLANVISLQHRDTLAQAAMRFLNTFGQEIGAIGATTKHKGVQSHVANCVFLAASRPYDAANTPSRTLTQSAPKLAFFRETPYPIGSTNTQYIKLMEWDTLFYWRWAGPKGQFFCSDSLNRINFGSGGVPSTEYNFQYDKNGDLIHNLNNTNAGSSASYQLRFNTNNLIRGYLMATNPLWSYGDFPAGGLVLKSYKDLELYAEDKEIRFNIGGNDLSSGRRGTLNSIGFYLGSTTATATSRLDVHGSNGYSQLRLRTTYTPANTADPNGNIGDTAWDDNYFYIKTSVGWKRTSLTTF